MNKINDLFEEWIKNKSEKNLEILIKEVTKRVSDRYKGLDENNDDIAQETALYAWRVLAKGGEELVAFNPERASFAAYIATRARTIRLNMQEREEVFYGEDIEDLEILLEEEEDGW